MNDFGIEVHDGDVSIEPRTIPRSLYLAQQAEIKHLQQEVSRLQKIVVRRFLEDLFEDIEDWPPDNWPWPYLDSN